MGDPISPEVGLIVTNGLLTFFKKGNNLSLRVHQSSLFMTILEVSMTYTVDNPTRSALERFQQFDVDTQLALLWFGYLDIKDQLQPAPHLL